MLEAGLVISCFLHYSAVLALFGIALSPLYLRELGAAASPELSRVLWILRTCVAVVALITAVLWLVFTGATMANTFDGATETLAAVIRETDFGHLWFWRLAVSGLVLLLCLVRFY